ncbi:MAG TPA: hypothetical protein VK698_28230 [Kofleriaceae bacterium]|nr:hypothetical protein [Kofleriaceae bacterium]
MRASVHLTFGSLFLVMLGGACGDNFDRGPDPETPDAGISIPDLDASLSDASLSDAAPPDANTAECVGVADGTPCGDANDSECDAADTCQGGVCVANVAADGDACGDPTDTECDAADSCLAGTCALNVAADTTPCGDPTDTECDAADSCLAGTCALNVAADGDACGDPTDAECDAADSCLAGTCALNVAADGDACGDPTDTECDGADSCLAGTCALNVATDGDACGDPTDTECDDPDSCSTGLCAGNLVADSTPCGDPTDTECDDPDSCSTGLCAGNLVANGTACGSNGDTDCDDPDSCSSGACAPNPEVDGTACYDCPAGMGLCDTCVSAACGDGPLCDLGNAGNLATTFPGGNSQNGNMFDLVAANAVTITSFEARPSSATTVEVYFKVGTHIGSESTAGAWTLIGSAAVAAAPAGATVAVPIPIDVTIPAGQTYAFYVTTNDTVAFVNYHNGTSRATVAASDTNLTILEGCGISYPFGSTFVTRVFEGVIHYTTALPSLSLDSSIGTATGVADSAMFDIEATSDVQEADRLSVELAAGTFDVDIYFRRGSHVGFAGSSDGWELSGSGIDMVSAGGGALTDIALAGPIDLSAGEMVSFYVDTGAGLAGLQVDPGGAVGDPAVVEAEQTLQVGIALAGGFGTIGAPTTFRGTLGYGVCVLE